MIYSGSYLVRMADPKFIDAMKTDHLPEMMLEKGDKLQKAEAKLKVHPFHMESWNVLIKDAQVIN